MANSYIRFDWAMRNILQFSSNYAILEGLFSTVLNQSVKIFNIFRNVKGNEEEFDNPFRIDVLAVNDQKEIILIELQHHNERAYFDKIIFGTSNFITKCVNSSGLYPFVRHIHCINVVHFPLMASKEKVFRGKKNLKSPGTQELLTHVPFIRQSFDVSEEFYLHPEFHVLCVHGFDEWTDNPLEQWIYYLNTGNIPDSASALGLTEAKEYLKMDWFNEEEMKSYYRHLDDLAILRDNIDTGRAEGRAEGLMEGRAEGEAKAKLETARNMKAMGLSLEIIRQATGLSGEEIEKL